MKAIPSLIVASLLCVGGTSYAQATTQESRVTKKRVARKELHDKESGNYFLTLPGDYDKHDKPWPVIVFLHGAGGLLEGRGALAPYSISKKLADFPFIVITPRCGKGDRWASEHQIKVLNAIMDEVLAGYRADKRRIYLTGLSMGGYGTWSLATHDPERFAAIAPICGGGRVEQAERLKSLPVSVYHCVKDYKVPLARSEQMVEALKKLGADVSLTVYPLGGIRDNPHDAWSRTYSNIEFYEWLLRHRIGPDGNVVTEDLSVATKRGEPWSESLPEFRRELFKHYRHYWGFTQIEGDDPLAGIRFSLAVRNPFADEMAVRVEWKNVDSDTWTIHASPTDVVVAPGRNKTIRFHAVAKAGRDIFPRPICKVSYGAAGEKGEFEIPFPIDVDGYLFRNRPKLLVRPCPTSPSIDGKLDDPIWQRPADVVKFLPCRLTGPAPVRTEAWVAYDKTNYYVAFRCHESRMDQLRPGPGKRDGELWKADSVEILIDTARDRKPIRHYYRRRGPSTFYQFIVSPDGAFFDAKVPDRKFDSGAVVATGKTADSWTVEIAIPWAALGVESPAKGTQMGFVLSRTLHPKRDEPNVDEPESLQYPALNGWVHRKEHYGDLLLE